VFSRSSEWFFFGHPGSHWEKPHADVVREEYIEDEPTNIEES